MPALRTEESEEATSYVAAELRRLALLQPEAARDQVYRLVLEYREQPFASLDAHAAAFDALLRVRSPGRPLREAFALFDEMPRRDMRWPQATLQLAIEALCHREREIDAHVAYLAGRPGAAVPSWLIGDRAQHLWHDREALYADQLKGEIDALRTEAPFRRALDLYLAHWRTIRTATANALLAECAVQAKINTTARMDTIAAKIIDCLERSPVAQPTAMSYVHLVAVHRARNDKAAVLAAFEAFTAATSAIALEADDAQHTSLVRPADSELPPHLDTPEQLLWAGVIGTLFDADDPTEGLAWLERMLEHDRAGATALLEVIVGFARIGDPESARTWLARVGGQGDEAVYVAIADAVLAELATARRVDDLNAVLVDVSEVSRENGFRYDDARWLATAVEVNLVALDRSERAEERRARLQEIEALRDRFALDRADGVAGLEPLVPTPALSLRLVRAFADEGMRNQAAVVYDDLVRSVWSTLTPAADPQLDRQTVTERRALLRDGAYAVAGIAEDGGAMFTEEPDLSLDSAVKICRALWAIDLRPVGALAQVVAHLYVKAKMDGTLPSTFTAADWPLVVDACAVALMQPGQAVEERHRRVFTMLVDDVVAAGVSLDSAPTLAWTAATLHDALGVDVAAPLVGRLAGCEPAVPVDGYPSPRSQGSVVNIAGLASPTLADWTPPSSVILTPPPYLESAADRRPETPPGQTYDDDLTLHVLSTLPKHRDAVLQAVEKGLAEGRCPHPMALAKLIDALANDPGRNARSMRRGQIERLYMVAYDALALFPDPEAATGDGGSQMTSWAQLEDSMLQAMAHLGDLDRVALHRDRLVAAGCTPSPDAFATMILNMRDTTDDATVAVEMFTEAKRLGVVPNAFLYNTLISRLSRARRATDALAYFDEMRRQGVEPTAVTFGSMINAVRRALPTVTIGT
jgi:pentatricopeptide repeat protein